MNLKEFWSSKKKLAIHCSTEEKADKLLRRFDAMGYRWDFKEDSYLSENFWRYYKQNSCYSNSGGYCSVEWYLSHGYKIIEFYDLEEFKDNDFVFDDDEERQHELSKYSLSELLEAVQRKLKGDIKNDARRI